MKKLLLLLIILLILPGVFSATYYVKANGNDNANGLSDATAWKTVNNIRTKLKAGDNVYFKAGDTWKTPMTIRTSGNQNNRIIIGSYYMQNGQERAGIPSNGARPIFQGTYFKDGDITGTSNSVPSGPYSGLITIDADYITVKEFRVENSAGMGIIINGGKGVQRKYNIIENNDIYYVAVTCTAFGRGGSFNIIRNNEMSFCAVGWKNRDLPWQVAGTGPAGYPAANAIATTDYNIFENNYVHQSYGEVVAVFDNARFNIVRRNIGASVRASIRVDDAPHTLVEQNIIFGDPGNNKFDFNDGKLDGYTSALTLAIEDYGYTQDTIGVMYRNNLLVNTDWCLSVGIQPRSKAEGKIVGGYYIGNTCINPGRAGLLSWEGAQHFGTMVFKNNIIGAPVEPEFGNKADRICVFPKDNDIVFDGNVWEVKPNDRDCLGPNDKYGSFNLERSNWQDTSVDNHPNVRDFQLKVGSIARDSGVPLTQRVLDASNFPQYSLSTGRCGEFDETLSKFDFHCEQRDRSNPSGGAIEFGSTGDLWHVGIGDSGSIANSGSYDCGQINPGENIAEQYGAPYDFDNNRKTMKATCSESNNANAEIGYSGSNYYIYQYGYLWKNNEWQQIELQGTKVSGSDVWIRDIANSQLNDIDPNNENFFLSYVCKWDGSRWKCGCHDSSCLNNYWNLQIIAK